MASLSSPTRYFITLTLTLLFVAACGGGDGGGGGPTPTATPTTPPAPDTTPESFSFAPQMDAALSAQVTSSAVTVAGIDAAAPISVSGGEYAVEGGDFVSTEGTISNGQSVVVRLTSAATFATSAAATLTIGGVSADFVVTTVAEDITPDDFAFAPALDAAPKTVVESNVQTITGINAASAISVIGGEFQIVDVQGYGATPGTITSGQQVQVRGVAPAALGETQDVVLTVGTASQTFSITTRSDTTDPTAAIAFPPPVSMTEGDAVTVRGTAEDTESDVVAVRVNGQAAADTSDDGSFSSWAISAVLAEGDNTLTVAVEDSAGNVATAAASVMVRRDASLGDFPNSENLLTRPLSVTVDYANNRAIVSDLPRTTLLAVDLSTGVRTEFSDTTNPDPTWTSMAIVGSLVHEASNRLLVADVRSDALYEIDLSTGVRSVLSNNESPAGNPQFATLFNMLFHPIQNNTVLISDQQSIISVDLESGIRSTFSSGTVNNGNTIVPAEDTSNSFQTVRGGVYYQPSQVILQTDEADQRILAVSIDTGARTIFSSKDEPNADNTFDEPNGIVLDTPRQRAIVNDTNLASLLSVSLENETRGVRTIFSSATVPNAFNSFIEPNQIFYDGQLGYALVIDEVLDALLAVDIVGGERVFLTRGDTPE